MRSCLPSAVLNPRICPLSPQSSQFLLYPQRRPRFSEDKPFKCAQKGCDKSFYHSRNLYTHEVQKHGRVPARKEASALHEGTIKHGSNDQESIWPATPSTTSACVSSNVPQPTDASGKDSSMFAADSMTSSVLMGLESLASVGESSKDDQQSNEQPEDILPF